MLARDPLLLRRAIELSAQSRAQGNHAENPTLALPCREVFARGQRAIEVIGPLLEDEAAAAHAGFWR